MTDRELAKQKFRDELEAVIDEIMQASDSDDENDASDDETAHHQHAETMEATDRPRVAAVDESGKRHQAELQNPSEHSNNNQAQQQQFDDIIATRPESSPSI